MAESKYGSISGDIRDIIECSVCLELPEEPKLLSCGHTLCLRCVQADHATQVRRGLAKDKLRCPVCRQDTPIPLGGVEQLLPDFRGIQLKEVVIKRERAKQRKHISKDVPSIFLNYQALADQFHEVVEQNPTSAKSFLAKYSATDIKKIISAGSTTYTESDLLARFFSTQNLEMVELIYTICDIDINKPVKNVPKESVKATPLSWASYYGIHSMMSVLITRGCDVNHQDEAGRTALMYAADNNQVEAVNMLIQHGANVNQQDNNDNTSLHCAYGKFIAVCYPRIIEVDQEIVEALLQSGADVDIVNNKRKSALHIACCLYHGCGIKILLQYGAKLDIKDIYGQTPIAYAIKQKLGHSVQLMLDKMFPMSGIKDFSGGNHPLLRAAESNNLDVALKFLQLGIDVDQGNNVKWTALHVACDRGYVDYVEMLLGHGAQKDIINNDGKTPLMLAIISNHHDVIQVLLDNAVDVDTCNNEGRTGLYFALVDRIINIMKKLLQHGANPNMTDTEGDTLLIHAHNMDAKAEEKLLLDHGADVNQGDIEGWTVLHADADQGNVESARMLLDHKANINVQDSAGTTPLMAAVINHHLDMMELLLDRGANINLGNHDGWTALCWATERSQLDTAENLLTHKANVGIRTKDGSTALMLAVCNNNLAVIRVLLQHGADVNSPDGEGRTPLHVAVRRNAFEVTTELLAHGANSKIRDKQGTTPLELAVKNNHQDIAQVIKHIQKNI